MTKKIDISDEKFQKKLSRQIMVEIDKVNPKSKQYFIFKDVWTAVVIVFFILISIYLVATFTFDLWEVSTIAKIRDLSWWQVSYNWLFEFIGIAGILGCATYWFYLQTDWILVKQRHAVAAIILGIILLGGGGLFAILKTTDRADMLSFLAEKSEQVLPYRQDRQTDMMNNLLKESIFVGKIDSIRKSFFIGESTSITIKNKQEARVININDKTIGRENIKEGNFIFVKFRVENKIWVAEKITPISEQSLKNFMSNTILKPRVKGINNIPMMKK